MAVESPNKSTISPLKFFNRTAKVNQQGPDIAKVRLTQIDYSLRGILSIRERSINTSRIEEEQSQRQEKEKKLEAGKFIVRGVGKLASAIPGKNTIQRFLIFMAFGWLFNTFSKYFGELGGPLSSIIGRSAQVIDVFSKIAFGIFNTFATFIDLGYKAWDVMRGVESPEKFQSALNDMVVGIDNFFGGILQQLGIIKSSEPSQSTPTIRPGTPSAPSTPSTRVGPSPSSGAPLSAPGSEKPGYYGPPTPQAPPTQVTGGIVPSQARITSGYGSQEGFRKKAHTGIDYGYPAGTEISLIRSGVVVEASKGYNGGYGNFILVQHSDGKYSMFNHLQDIYVQKGQKINASEGNAPVIGTIGNTGFSTGDHLDYKVATKWDGYNPSGFINPTSYQDRVFRIGSDVTIKPSQVQKLGKENGKEGIIINGQWRAKPWTNEERERYSRVSGIQQEQAKGSTSGRASSGGGGNLKPLLDMISSGESPGGGYTAMFPSESHPQILDMTIAEVIAFQKEKLKDGRASAAIGRYQMLYPENYASAAGLSLNDKFSPENQDKMVIAYLKKNRKLDLWLQGKISDEDFSEELAGEFGTFKSASGFVLPNNTGSIDFNKMKPVFNKIKQSQSSSQSLAKPTPTPTSQASAQAAQEYAASKGKYYSSTTGKTYGSYSQALKDPEVQKGLKPERWATDPRGWFGLKDGGIVGEIPKQTKATDISSLESYPSYSPESGESMKVAIQPVIIKVPTPSGSNNSTSFPVAIGVNNSMSNTSKLYA